MVRIVAQQAAVAQIGQRALETSSLEALLQEACVLVGRVLECDLVSITELGGDGTTLKVVAGEGWRPGIVGQLELPSGAGSQAGYALLRGGPVIVDDFSTETRFAMAESLADHDVASGMSVRIGGPDRPFGILSTFSTQVGRFSRDDAHFLQSVANVLAAAIDRNAIEQELRASRDELAAIVSSIDDGITVQGADGKLLYANDTAARIAGLQVGDELVEMSNNQGLGPFEMVGDDGNPLSPELLPGRRVLAGEEPGEPLVIGFRNRATGEQRWSKISARAVRDARGRLVRVVNTFHDVTDERWASDSRAYMADAVAVMTSSLDVSVAAQRLADLSVPRLADYCTVTLRQADGSLKAVAIAHANPERVEIVRHLEKLVPPMDPAAPTGTPKVIREGITETAEITPEMIDAAPMTDEVRALVHKLELRGYVTVPLFSRRGPIGALSLAMAESGRSLSQRQIALAEELGTRAGVALENARLYQASDERRAELLAVLTAFEDAVLVFGPDGVLQIGNPAAESAFGAQLPQTLEELNAALRAAADTALDGPAVEAEINGRWYEARTYAAPSAVADGASPTVVVLRDVSQERAGRAARDAFVSVLSHELRTPITTIYGGSELLERALDEEQRRQVIADIRGESERLVRLIEDLLVMSRVERDLVEVADEPILVQHLLGSVIESFRTQHPAVEIATEAEPGLPAVRGDPTYVEQVARNLLSNAVRYGDGELRGITVRADTHDGFVNIRVLDTGDGFNGEDPERLFELFYRSARARSVPGGAGIGLFVCRNLIERMGGRVWASERPTGGAEFGFCLPILDADAAA